MMKPDFEERVADADAFAIEASVELGHLVNEASKAAEALSGYTAGHELNIDRLALDGAKGELELWRTTRLTDARWRELLVRWRGHWRNVVGQRTRFVHLKPRGLDLYLWEYPEECDHEAVRLGVKYVQRDGLLELTPLHVDIVRVAQQESPVRLLGPSVALDEIGQDGIVQEAHPLRSGTRHSGIENVYRWDRPTWVPPKVDPPTPAHHVQTAHDTAAWINHGRATGELTDDSLRLHLE